jgi:hypothetical protein
VPHSAAGAGRAHIFHHWYELHRLLQHSGRLRTGTPDRMRGEARQSGLKSHQTRLKFHPKSYWRTLEPYFSTVRAGWHAGCIIAATGMWVATYATETSFALTPQISVAGVLTEDPPFGGLWCDQPAIFLSRGFGLPAPNLYCLRAARRRTIGTKVSKSTGFGTCRSKPASIAAATSPRDA